MAEAKGLVLKNSDIRTMAKDIRMLKKFGFLRKHEKDAVIQKEESKKQFSEHKASEGAMEEILGQAIQKRQAMDQAKETDKKSGKEEVIRKIDTLAVKKPIVKATKLELETESQTNQFPSVDAINQTNEKPEIITDKYRETIDQQHNKSVGQNPPAQNEKRETVIPTTIEPESTIKTQQKQIEKENIDVHQPNVAEQDARKKFMQDIEDWASHNN